MCVVGSDVYNAVYAGEDRTSLRVGISNRLYIHDGKCNDSNLMALHLYPNTCNPDGFRIWVLDLA